MSKLEIIGWTSYNSKCQNIIIGESNHAEIIMALVNEIKNNKYLFYGDQHQNSRLNCVPVFNNGKCFRGTMRSIASIMSIAHENTIDNYMNYYMKMNGNILENLPKNIVDSKAFKLEEGYDDVLPCAINPDFQLIFDCIKYNMPLLTDDVAVKRNYEYILKNKDKYDL